MLHSLRVNGTVVHMAQPLLGCISGAKTSLTCPSQTWKLWKYYGTESWKANSMKQITVFSIQNSPIFCLEWYRTLQKRYGQDGWHWPRFIPIHKAT